MRKLMIATDLSARGDRAFQRAFQFAKDLGAELAIVHVVDDAQPAAAVELQVQNAKAELHKQVSALPNTEGVAHTFSIIQGQDYSDIIRHATEIGAELIILGIHRHKIKDLFRGTTVERVIRLCSIPVLVVKDVVKGPPTRRHLSRSTCPSIRGLPCALPGGCCLVDSWNSSTPRTNRSRRFSGATLWINSPNRNSRHSWPSSTQTSPP